MSGDERFELALQALLDGRALPDEEPPAEQLPPDAPLRVIDAIARACRLAIFGGDAPPPPPHGNRWGHLEIRGEIGRGASGTVYRAWDTTLNREVALKLLEPDLLGSRSVLEEGRLLARLNDPHIVRVFGADSHDGVGGIWMELLDGETLDEILARDGVFGAEDALLVGIDLARALSAVHAAGLLHRDIKGRNVLRERGGRIVLTDLGAGRMVDDRSAGSGEAGTPMYMAPEVLAGGAATVQSDIYSLGVLLYRLLTRRYPVIASDAASLRAAHAARRHVTLGEARPELPAAVAGAIERAFEWNIDRRYASAADLEAALTRAFHHSLTERTAVASAIKRRWAAWKTRAYLGSSVAAAAALAVWMMWDTAGGRSIRRVAGLTVPPRSTLYLAMNGAIGILQGSRLSIRPFNPNSAGTIAVSSDLGILTMASNAPWTAGAVFGLDGTLVGSPTVRNDNGCCWPDGTTDGEFNYAVRQDSTMLEPIGSRALAPPAVFRFGRDWSNPRQAFPLDPTGTYLGIAYSARSRSFWLTRVGRDQSRIEQWSRDGVRLSTPVVAPAAIFMSIAADPRDGTLWVVRDQSGALRLENFDASGQHLFSLDVEAPHPLLNASGVEFAWIGR